MSKQTNGSDVRSNLVWKVGSRWSNDGHAGSSVLHIFRRHNVVFVGTSLENFQKIKEGELIAVSDGKKVVALGVVRSRVTPLIKLNLAFSREELEHFDLNGSILAVRLSFTDLDEVDYVDCRIGAFHRVHERAKEFITLYARYNKQYQQEQGFDIKARSCTLLTTTSNQDEVLWKKGFHLQVPVYQRAYSWGEQEIKRLLSDLLTAFLGRLGRATEEPMFIGTMQLSAPVKFDNTDDKTQDVIDGQQRSTTLILTLKALQQLIPESDFWKTINLRSYLSTMVNGGLQQEYLDQALEDDFSGQILNVQNPYQKALHIIFEELKNEEDLNDNKKKIEAFVHYLTRKVYFVVIETRATLSKTLQIFDAINTSGMDLNGGDVFKIRFYEYLKEIHKEKDSVFEKICNLYEKINRRNEEIERKAVRIESVLSLAQQIIITETDMSSILRSLASTTFFERFFDTILNINHWPYFDKDACKKVELTIDKLDKLVELQFNWEGRNTDLNSLESETMAAFIRHTRYGRYYQVLHMFRYSFSPTKEELEAFIISFSKLLSIMSVQFQKVTNDGNKLVYEIMKKICAPEQKLHKDEVVLFINKVRHKKLDHLKNVLENENFAHIPKAKNLLCRLDAMLDELEHSELEFKDLRSLLFDEKIDIEHIESANHEDSKMRKTIHDEWGGELHRLGNLVILEFDINRSISNGDYATIKRPRYKESKFISVKNFSVEHEQWSLEQCRDRKIKLVNKLSTYLCV